MKALREDGKFSLTERESATGWEVSLLVLSVRYHMSAVSRCYISSRLLPTKRWALFFGRYYCSCFEFPQLFRVRRG